MEDSRVMMMSSPSRAIERLGALLSRYTGQVLSESRLWRIETSLRPGVVAVIMQRCR